MRSGSHRRDKDANGTYDEAEAVRIMDAWWPRLVEAEFKPSLGKKLFAAIASVIPLHDAPGPVGSAFINGWYGYVNKDLRTVLDSDDVSGRFSRTYCGAASCASAARRWCGRSATRSNTPPTPSCTRASPVRAATPSGATTRSATPRPARSTQPPIHWIDRPTFQQVVQIGEQP